MRKVLLLVSIFFVLSLSSVYALSCGDTITTDTVLDTDLTCGGTALHIGANNIVLDCNSHTITGPGKTGFSFGIFDWTERTNVTIKNCFITNFNRGIYLGYYQNSRLINNKFFDNSIGCDLFALSHSIIENNEAFNNDGYYGAFSLDSCSYINITNNLVHNNYRGFYIGYNDAYNTLSYNRVYDNSIGGITLYWSVFNTIKNNLVYNQLGTGIFLQGSNNNAILNNEVHDNSVSWWSAGIQLEDSNDNQIYHNNIIENKNQAWDRAGWDKPETYNEWDDGYPSGGNYWSGTCSDIYKGINQNEPGSDGICDTPYAVSYFGTQTKFDHYPFTNQNGWDSDGDGVPNSEDKCPNTIDEQLVYGCSCEQILDLKPGENTATNREGCSKGIVEVFTKGIGWAKDLFG